MKKYYSLIDKIYAAGNLARAFAKVLANKGAPGVDGQSVDAFQANLELELKTLHRELVTDTYQPKPVRRVNIPKKSGGVRPLGIPAVRDRVVQQALVNVLEPIFEPHFHPSSYAYRPGRSPQNAVAKAEAFMNKYGLPHVVDMDLSRCFDTLDHEFIIERVAERVSDGHVLRLIRAFLKAGVMEGAIVKESEIGSPQGGPASPLLSNIYLDVFDQEMRERGIRIVRYADDIRIFAKNRHQARRHLATATAILQKGMRLIVNEQKTKLTTVYEGVAFLGFIIRPRYVAIDPREIAEFKDNVRKMTPRNHGRNVKTMIVKLNPYLRGWANYYRAANCKSLLGELAKWVRRRLRMKQMKEWKSYKALHKALRRQGYQGTFEKMAMNKWRNSASPLVNMALPNTLFVQWGLFNLATYEVGILYRYYK